MKKLFQILGKRTPKKGLLGIEIEAEGKGMQAVDTALWYSENDGSLRGVYPETRSEFVLREPIAQADVVNALEELKESLPFAQFDFSFRTSVHVHVNVQELTHTQILNMVYTYFLLEEPLMNYCGKDRKANRFCLRLADAEGLMETVVKMVKRGEGSHILCDDNVRYSAINLAALNKYGSIEFRGMRGNMDIDILRNWTGALVYLREYAMAQESPETIHKELENLGTAGFLKSVLKELAPVYEYPRMQRDMARSYSISLDIPFAFAAAKDQKAMLGEVVFVEDGDHRMVNQLRIDGQKMIYMRNLYEFTDGDWRVIGPAPAVPKAKAAKKVFAVHDFDIGG